VRDNNTGSGTTAVSTLNVTLTTTNAGDLFVALLGGYNAGVAITGTTVSTNNGTACAHVAGTLANEGPTTSWSDMWNCPNNAAGGSVTLTATYTVPAGANPANTTNYPSLTVGEFSGAKPSAPDMGLGGLATYPSSATIMNVATTGSVGVGDLVVSRNEEGTGTFTSYGVGQTAFSNDAAASYQIVATAGTITHTYNFSPSGTGALSIGAFAHP
jgi:surface antigen